MKTDQTKDKGPVKKPDTSVGRIHEATLGGWYELRLTFPVLTVYRKA